MPKKDFFEDLAALIPNAEAACEICAGAFAAEGRDAHGRLPRQTCIDLADEDDFDEERWTPQRMENMRCAGPFDNGKDLADGLNTVWENYRGLGSLRCALMDAVRQNLESIRARQEGRDAVRERFEGLRRMAGLTREGAVRSWEVSQVNEILARMEDYRGVFVAATNFLSSLDPAVLRRFTFKLAFGYLDRAGKRTFFERFFREPLTAAEEEELAAIPRLCPGDFRTVRQHLWYLPGVADNARRLAALREESAQKDRLGPAFDDAERLPLGF